MSLYKETNAVYTRRQTHLPYTCTLYLTGTVYICTCVGMCVYMYMCLCIYVYIHVCCVCVYECVSTCVCMCMYIHTCTGYPLLVCVVLAIYTTFPSTISQPFHLQISLLYKPVRQGSQSLELLCQ